MAGTFDMLRANDLIFNYVVSNWLMGQEPPAFDILAWNGDSTRMPAAMHSFYLRSLYMRNELARGDMELAGQRLSLASVKNDTYVVGAINDHIVPWHGSFKTIGLMGGTVRYVLSSGGHIAGIVNPPGPKAWYEATSRSHTDPEAVARRGHQAQRVLVAGLDRVVRCPGWRAHKAARDGQPPVSGPGRRAWGLREGLSYHHG